jgi:hypothetical protein
MKKIFGKIESEWGIPPELRMRVLAWDSDIDDDDHMGTSQVNPDGTYTIEISDKKWDWSPFTNAWRPDVYLVVEVFNDIYETWNEVTRTEIRSDLDLRDPQEINLYVDFSYTNSNSIYGSIKTKEGKPLSKVIVSAWDEKISIYGSQPLGSSSQTDEMNPGDSSVFIGRSQTNEKGEYRILFDPNKFAITLDRVLKEGLDAMRRPDIFIKVHNLDGEKELFRSPTKQNVICQFGCKIDAQI